MPFTTLPGAPMPVIPLDFNDDDVDDSLGGGGAWAKLVPFAVLVFVLLLLLLLGLMLLVLFGGCDAAGAVAVGGNSGNVPELFDSGRGSDPLVVRLLPLLLLLPLAPIEAPAGYGRLGGGGRAAGAGDGLGVPAACNGKTGLALPPKPIIAPPLLSGVRPVVEKSDFLGLGEETNAVLVDVGDCPWLLLLLLLLVVLLLLLLIGGSCAVFVAGVLPTPPPAAVIADAGIVVLVVVVDVEPEGNTPTELPLDA